ncbi:MAG TPA: hypothetical protein VFM18_11805 [Methanosarcina sp.]|nr:hypothetical protein [Methanosarcina sp.]
MTEDNKKLMLAYSINQLEKVAGFDAAWHWMQISHIWKDSRIPSMQPRKIEEALLFVSQSLDDLKDTKCNINALMNTIHDEHKRLRDFRNINTLPSVRVGFEKQGKIYVK